MPGKNITLPGVEFSEVELFLQMDGEGAEHSESKLYYGFTARCKVFSAICPLKLTERLIMKSFYFLNLKVVTNR